jgi:hypothetical protein
MPFKSKAQRRLFYSRKDLHHYIPEFEKGTKKRLPEHIKKTKKKK